MPPFDSRRSFLDPLLTSDGKPFAPVRIDRIITECYIISKRCHTSYVDVLEISPKERETLLNIIKMEMDKEKEDLEKAAQQIKENRR